MGRAAQAAVGNVGEAWSPTSGPRLSIPSCGMSTSTLREGFHREEQLPHFPQVGTVAGLLKRRKEATDARADRNRARIVVQGHRRYVFGEETPALGEVLV